MAKLKGPLFSLGARGAIAKTLVYSAWKGIDTVREYVIPANPQTSPQTIQRGYLTAAVAKIHAVQAQAGSPMTEADTSAAALLGTTFPTPRTWFNQLVKIWNDVKVATKDPLLYSNGDCTDTDITAIDLSAAINEETGSQLAAGKFYFGTTKTNLLRSAVATVNAGSDINIINEDLSAWMVAGVKYFWQFRPDVGDPSEGNVSGIYYFTAS